MDGVGEARPVGFHLAAPRAAAGHVELAVPVLGRQTDLEVDRGPDVAQHPAVLGQIVRGRHDRRGEEVCILDLQVFERSAVTWRLGRDRAGEPSRRWPRQRRCKSSVRAWSFSKFVPSGSTLADVMRRPFGAAPIGSPRRKKHRAYHRRPDIQRANTEHAGAVRAIAGEPAVRQGWIVDADVTVALGPWRRFSRRAGRATVSASRLRARRPALPSLRQLVWL